MKSYFILATLKTCFYCTLVTQKLRFIYKIFEDIRNSKATVLNIFYNFHALK